SWEVFKADADSDKGNRISLMGGFNYWIKGHQVNLKAQFGASKVWQTADEPAWARVVTVQSQLLFK
ncbi:MAG: hypothetical protein JRH20_25265, partial [Deltaproteobacteria bacterium]|nr:hypothetical protein [Deltaproteobacteria bacterium]